MCLNPLTIDISKRKRYFNLGDVLRKSVTVPCGKCYQCQMSSRNDLLLRVRSEYQQCVSAGGQVAFLTFTYSDEHVPCYTYHLEDDLTVDDPKASMLVFTRIPHSYVPNTDGKWVFGFDKVQFRNSIKVMRQTLKRLGYKGKLRYICVSEYGTNEYHTQRPHYHALFFMDKELLALLNANGINFTEFCNRYWKYGNVSESDKGLFLQDIKGCEYVAKYVTKANQLLELRQFQHLMDYIKSCFNPRDRNYSRFYTDTGSIICKPYTYFSKVVRSFGLSYFVLKSLHFGSQILTDLESLPHEDLLSTISHGVDVEKYGESRQYKYPSYILRKLLFNNRSDGSYYLNKLGISLYMDKSVKNYFTLVDSTVGFLQTHLSYFQRLNVSSDIYDKSALLEFSNSVPLLMFYNTFVRGRVFPAEVSDEVNDFVSSFDSLYKDKDMFSIRLHSLSRHLLDAEIFDECVDLDCDPDSDPLAAVFGTSEFEFLYPDGVNSCQREDFDYLIDNYSAARAYLGSLKSEEYERQNKKLKAIKDKMDFETYKLN